jgi:tagatose 6-phosphate kinase
MILTITPNPCVDKTLFIDTFTAGTKVRAPRYTTIPGGKGTNVARVVKALGHESAALVVVGGHTGRHVVDMIEQQDGTPCLPFWVAGATRTITTVYEEAERRQTAFFEPGPDVTEAEAGALLAFAAQAAAGAGVVTFNGAVPNPALQDLYGWLIAYLQKKAPGVTTILDSYGEEFLRGLKAMPHVVKPNVEEAEALLGRPLQTLTARKEAMAYFHEHGVEMAVLSMGREGALVSDGRTCVHAVPPAVEEINPVGSGDALVAVLAVGLLEGWDLERICRWGMAAGAANAARWELGVVEPAEVEALAAQVELREI